MNMKLLVLLMTLFALSNANTDKVKTKTFSGLLNRLKHLEKLVFEDLDKSVQIQTPQGIENACECEDLFAEHLEQFMRSVKSAMPLSQYRNILSDVKALQKYVSKNGSKVNCTFTTHNLTRVTSDNIRLLIQDNINFIQKWNTICKPKQK